MSKQSVDDPELLEVVAAAVAECWNEGSPVAGRDADAWRSLAAHVLRRVRSFERRGVPADDRAAKVRDVARGVVQLSGGDWKFEGALMRDYEYVAERALAAIELYSGKVE